jgi:hypothetical protein
LEKGYLFSRVGLELAGIDLDFSLLGTNSPTLCMSPAGNWSRNFRKVLRPDSELLTLSAVLLEGAVMDLHNSTAYDIKSSALKVSCGPPGIGAKSQGRCSETLIN